MKHKVKDPKETSKIKKVKTNKPEKSKIKFDLTKRASDKPPKTSKRKTKKNAVTSENPGDLNEDITVVDLVDKDDPYERHFNYDLSPSLLDALTSNPRKSTTCEVHWPSLGKMMYTRPAFDASSAPQLALSSEKLIESVTALPERHPDKFDFDALFVKSRLRTNLADANKRCNGLEKLSGLQEDLLTLMCSYKDVYYPERNTENGEEVRLMYCVHVVNHILKSRATILHNNRLRSEGKDEEFRDQGLVRPKVLILVPFRESALRVIRMIIWVLLGEKGQVFKKNMLMERYTGGEMHMPQRKPKPKDYQEMFAGNIDDNFKMGLSFTKKAVKLFQPFYESDVIIASPLGLRMLIGSETDSNRDYDFLASLELLILDQADVLQQQNWEHVLHVLLHTHLTPKHLHGTDITRVRSWAVQGWARYYRQTIVTASSPLPLITALATNLAANHSGRVTVLNPVLEPAITRVAAHIPQLFHGFASPTPSSAVSARLNTFLTDILPRFQAPNFSHTLIYIPSYFDFVKIRNHFKAQQMSFVQICEYSDDDKIKRARGKFCKGTSKFLLYSERFHFFRRIRLKGIHHIVFYQPPSYSHFYSELLNYMLDSREEADKSVTVIYNKFDVHQLAGILGTQRTTTIITSENNTHLFLTHSF